MKWSCICPTPADVNSGGDWWQNRLASGEINHKGLSLCTELLIPISLLSKTCSSGRPCFSALHSGLNNVYISKELKAQGERGGRDIKCRQNKCVCVYCGMRPFTQTKLFFSFPGDGTARASVNSSLQVIMKEKERKVKWSLSNLHISPSRQEMEKWVDTTTVAKR